MVLHPLGFDWPSNQFLVRPGKREVQESDGRAVHSRQHTVCTGLLTYAPCTTRRCHAFLHIAATGRPCAHKQEALTIFRNNCLSHAVPRAQTKAQASHSRHS